MFGNFSGKGQVGLFDPGNVQETPATRIISNKIDGHGVGYWHAFAMTLSNGVKGLIDERNEEIRVSLERKAIDAGLRAVIRVALAEIRKVNPNHPLLDKKNRDRIFAEFEKQEMEKLLKARGEQMWDPLLVSDKSHQSE